MGIGRERLKCEAREPTLTPPIYSTEPSPTYVMREGLERPEVAKQPGRTGADRSRIFYPSVSSSWTPTRRRADFAPQA